MFRWTAYVKQDTWGHTGQVTAAGLTDTCLLGGSVKTTALLKSPLQYRITKLRLVSYAQLFVRCIRSDPECRQTRGIQVKKKKVL